MLCRTKFQVMKAVSSLFIGSGITVNLLFRFDERQNSDVDMWLLYTGKAADAIITVVVVFGGFAGFIITSSPSETNSELNGWSSTGRPGRPMNYLECMRCD